MSTALKKTSEDEPYQFRVIRNGSGPLIPSDAAGIQGDFNRRLVQSYRESRKV